MELTPIKIRGKRRRKGEHPPLAAKERSKPNSKRQKRAKDLSFKMSSLEKEIPLEVMERIFWMSENLNLPRASPRLGLLLSSKSTLQETFIQAFAPSWDAWLTNYVKWFATQFDIDDTKDIAEAKEDPKSSASAVFQSDILSCPWATMPLVLQCWDLWARRGVQGRIFRYPEFAEIASDEPSSTQRPQMNVSSQQFFNHDWQRFQNFWVPEKWSEPTIPAALKPCFIAVHPEIRISDALLIGPWDDDAVQKLFWLASGGATLHADQTWETTLESFHNAVPDVPGRLNETVVRILHSLDVFIDWPDDVLMMERDRILRLSESSPNSYDKVWAILEGWLERTDGRSDLLQGLAEDHIRHKFRILWSSN